VQTSPYALRFYLVAYFVAIGAYLPYFPSWLSAQGIDGLRMGAISALLPLMTVLGPPGFGMLADALGLRAALLRWASLGCVLSFGAIYVFSQVGHVLGFTGLLVCIFLFGFFRTPMGLLADVVALEQGGDYARIRLFGSLGFMLAAPLVGRYVNLHSPSALPGVILGGLVAGHLATWC
jgi:MFS transporter, PPP family, 3-phenylpropionic acid transporter